MAVKKALCNYSGEIKEVATGDTLSNIAPAGSTTQVQYNNASALAGASNVTIDSNDITLLANASPSAPSSGYKLISQSIATKSTLVGVRNNTIIEPVQTQLSRRKIGWWNPAGNNTTIPGQNGVSAPTFVGTATQRDVATTNYFTRIKRVGYVSTATAGSLTSARTTVAQYTIGDGSGIGGFYFCMVFGCSDAATVSGARQFVGLSSTTGAPTNVDPGTLTNCLGVGHSNADTNLYIYYGGSAAQTRIDLASNFPANTLSTDMYELILFADAYGSTVGYQVTRLNTGHVASGTLSGTVGTALPATTTLLNQWCWRTNNATALAVGLDYSYYYFEQLH